MTGSFGEAHLVDDHGGCRFRHGPQFQTDLGKHPEGTEGPGHGAREVISSHVLDDTAACPDTLSPPVDELDAEDEIAHASHLETTRSRQSAGDHATDCRRWADMRWFERELLAIGR